VENRLTRAIYDHSPIALQNLYVSVYGFQKRFIRYGRAYRKYYRFFTETATWSRSELEAYQDEKVREVVRLAYENVPFHRNRMESLNLKPEDIRRVADLPKLPITEKADARGAGEDRFSMAVPRWKRLSAPTSGSTGFPITNFWTRDTVQREYAFHWARCRPGVKPGDSYGSFTGLQLVPVESLIPPFWRHNLAANQTCYSIFHLTPETVPLYLEKMKQMGHVFLEGYPSVVAILAKFILDHDMDRPCSPRAVYTEAEEVLDEHRRWIEEGFQTRVFEMYGQSEKAAAVTEYACGHLHYDMDYSVIEFLPVGREDGMTVCDMICTAFDNPLYPLIRYRIGDLAVLPDEPVACDEMASPVLRSIHGRTGHTLISRDGRQIRNISVIVKRCHNVDMVQCVQEEPGEVEVRIVKTPAYTKEDEENLRRQFQLKMGEMAFHLVYVDGPEHMERTRRGKFLSIISKVPPEKRAAVVLGQ